MNDQEPSIAEQLAEWGKVALLETRGRISGRPVRNAVGFVEDDREPGALLIAAGSEMADWALNLRHEPACRLTIGQRGDSYLAEEIDGAERSAAVTSLILKYGTPSERLGRGPVFRLHPARRQSDSQ